MAIKILDLLAASLAAFAMAPCAAEVPSPSHECISGIYPHLAMFNDERECGTGAVVPWAGDVWVITYGPHCPVGSTDKLYRIHPDLTRETVAASVGGTHANRLIHRETNQLLIGPYVIDGRGNVRVVTPAKIPGRLTGAARHLVDPANKAYVATMETGLYELDLRTLAVRTLIRENGKNDSAIQTYLKKEKQPWPAGWGSAPVTHVPGYHAKGLASGFGRVFISNNGEDSPEARLNPFVPSGVLAWWSEPGRDWTAIRRCQFTEVTTPDGIYGNEHPAKNPIWAMGWDAKSVILGVTTNGTEWAYYRLPKASHCYDGAHGWNTEWPRIRDVGEKELLATMHGTFWRFPREFSPAHPNGIRPISTYLKVVGDFCRWGDRIVFGCDDQAKSEFLGVRGLKRDAKRCERSQSNLWFVKPEDLRAFGPPSGEGYVWLNEDVKAGDVSEPYLHAGYASMRFSFTRADASPVRYELLEEGDWVRVRCLEDAKNATACFRYGPAKCAVPALDSATPRIAVTDDAGRRWHFPNVNGDTNVVCREIATERDLLYVGGVWYELPAENAGGFAALRPIALASEPVKALEARLGLMYVNGQAMAIDDLWKNGTAAAAYWLWEVEKGVARKMPTAEIAIPGNAGRITRYAADELRYHLERATGGEIVIVDELAPRRTRRFHVGATAAARHAGIDPDALQAEERIVRGSGEDVILVGGDRDAPSGTPTSIGDRSGKVAAGTLYAVYDFLESVMGVKWLWPGITGEVIPKRPIPDTRNLNLHGREPLEMRWYGGESDTVCEPQGSTFYGWAEVANARADIANRKKWLIRCRIGARRYFNGGHAFTHWWRLYGKDHPEYFALLPNGKREALEGDKDGRNTPMCLSSAAFQEKAIERWLASTQSKAKPWYVPCVNCCDNDSPGMCICEGCRAWDAKSDDRFAKNEYWNLSYKGPFRSRGRFRLITSVQWGEDGDTKVRPVQPSLSDRYAKFYNTVLAKARRHVKDAEVYGYAYANYSEAPRETRVSDGVIVYYVPRMFFPYTADVSVAFRRDWLGWSKAGAKQMIYRPNYMLAGANLPYCTARRIAADINFAATNGMIAISQDSLIGVWSAQSLHNYVVTRLMREPTARYEKLLDEYVEAFGSAANEIREYCALVESVGAGLSLADWQEMSMRNKSPDGLLAGGSFKNFITMAADLYSEAWFAKVKDALVRARAKCADDPDSAARVDFLAKGLEDAYLTYLTRVAQKSGDKKAFTAALCRLDAYRASVEADGICQYYWTATRERSGAGWYHKRKENK